MIREFRCKQGVDELGCNEEFTSDLFHAKDPKETAHLDDEGLVRPGTRVAPKLLLAGKQGATRHYSKASFVTEFEKLLSGQADLIAKYGHMVADGSLRAPEGVYGVVRRAYFVGAAPNIEAVVEVEVDTQCAF